MDAFNDCDAEDLAEALAFSCNTNANGATCGSLINTTLTLTMAAAEACNCSSPCTTCPTGCLEALQNVQNAVGCCVNAADLEIVQSLESEEVDNDEEDSDEEDTTGIIRNLCGLQPPTACSPGPLRADAKGLLVGKASVVGLTILATCMLVLLFQ